MRPYVRVILMPDLIHLSFSPEMEKAILEGRKIMTSRRESRPEWRPGPGVFRVGDRNYQIVACWWGYYKLIRDRLYAAEGFSSPEELDQYFRGLGYPTHDRAHYFMIFFRPWGDQ